MLFRREFYGYFKYSQVREWIIIQTHLKNYLMLVIKSIPNQISFENQLCFMLLTSTKEMQETRICLYKNAFFSHE